MSRRQSLATKLTAFLAGAVVQAQTTSTETWTVIPNAPAVSGPVVTYDSARQEIVLVGLGASGFETWIWNGALWALRTPALRPSARTGHCVAYDSSRQQIVLFGGSDGSAILADTWTWNGLNWMQQHPAFSPNAGATTSTFGAGQAMAYDSGRACVVLLNGSQICEWNGTGWVDRTPFTFGSSNSAFSVAVFDPLTQRVVHSRFPLWASSYAGDYAWNGQAYTQIQAVASFSALALATNAASGRVGRFSRVSGAYLLSEYGAGTWLGVATVNLTCCVQGVFSAQCLAFDAARNQFVVYGAHGAGPLFAVQGSGPVLAGASIVGASCGPAGLQLVPDPGARPILGASARCRITGAPTPVFALTVGFSTQFYGPFPLPLPLDGFGMNGCVLRHSADILGVAVTPVGADLEYALAVPATAQLLGFPLYLHGYGYAPGANSAQIALTNRLDWIVGNQ